MDISTEMASTKELNLSASLSQLCCPPDLVLFKRKTSSLANLSCQAPALKENLVLQESSVEQIFTIPGGIVMNWAFRGVSLGFFQILFGKRSSV